MVFAQLCHTGVEQMGIIDGVQQVLSLPTGLLQGKAQLLADAAGTQRVLPYPDEALTAQSIQEGDTVALLPDGTLKKLRCI